MTFLPRYLNHLHNLLALEKGRMHEASYNTYRLFQHMLNKELCKRIIFDARQAKIFDEMGGFDEEKKHKIHPPFPFFYMEFTEPIYIQSQEPGQKDLLCAFLYSPKLQDETEILESRIKRTVQPTQITFFLQSEDRKEFVDRTWNVAPEGYPLAGTPEKWRSISSAKGDATYSSVYPTDSSALPDWAKEPGVCINMHKLLKRTWWEESCIANTELVFWICAYMMAKSVTVVQISFTRQVRRALEREGKVPNPWHIVKVEPKFASGVKNEGVGAGSKHSYRYDVISHLRFGKHKLKDGTYRDSIEWVSSHQRGLENELYIPKTYKVEKNKKIADGPMQKYLDQKD